MAIQVATGYVTICLRRNPKLIAARVDLLSTQQSATFRPFVRPSQQPNRFDRASSLDFRRRYGCIY
jgi:hypothetical protein